MLTDIDSSDSSQRRTVVVQKAGSGSLYLRGKIWWIKYRQGGKVVRESSGTDDRNYAQDFLRARVCLPRYRASLPDLGAASQCTVGAIAELTVAVGLMNVGYAVYRSFSHNSSCQTKWRN